MSEEFVTPEGFREIVFTNGVFDILHEGHIELLKHCRDLKSLFSGHYDKEFRNGWVVVGINSDESTKRLKGEDRPVNSQDVRKRNLEKIPFVDEVIIFEEDTPYELIKELEPYCIVKGGDYEPDDVVGKDIAPVYIVPTVEGYSTTKIIEEMSQ